MPVETGRAPWLMEAAAFKDVVSSPPWGRVGMRGTKKAHTCFPSLLSVLIHALWGLYYGGSVLLGTDSSLLI